jgi:hypothetical protein
MGRNCSIRRSTQLSFLQRVDSLFSTDIKSHPRSLKIQVLGVLLIKSTHTIQVIQVPFSREKFDRALFSVRVSFAKLFPVYALGP